MDASKDVESFERQRRALLLLRLLAQGDRDYEAGRALTGPEVDARMRRRLRDRSEE